MPDARVVGVLRNFILFFALFTILVSLPNRVTFPLSQSDARFSRCAGEKQFRTRHFVSLSDLCAYFQQNFAHTLWIGRADCLEQGGCFIVWFGLAHMLVGGHGRDVHDCRVGEYEELYL